MPEKFRISRSKRENGTVRKSTIDRPYHQPADRTSTRMFAIEPLAKIEVISEDPNPQLKMCSRRKKEHQISCGDETGVYPDPAPKAYRFSMSILGHHLVENIILSSYKSVIITVCFEL